MYPKVFKVGGKNLGCSAEGFEAAKDWDLVAGLGTPNFGVPEVPVLRGSMNGSGVKRESLVI